MDNQQVHINAMIESLTQSNTNLTLQLADARGYIAVLQEELKKFTEPQDAELPKSDI